MVTFRCLISHTCFGPSRGCNLLMASLGRRFCLCRLIWPWLCFSKNAHIKPRLGLSSSVISSILLLQVLMISCGNRGRMVVVALKLPILWIISCRAGFYPVIIALSLILYVLRRLLLDDLYAYYYCFISSCYAKSDY